MPVDDVELSGLTVRQVERAQAQAARARQASNAIIHTISDLRLALEALVKALTPAG